MKLYRKSIMSVQSLRTGLSVLCFLFVMCMLAGCGSEDELLSGLRREAASDEKEAKDAVTKGEGSGEMGSEDPEAAEAVTDFEQGTSVGEIQGAAQNADIVNRENQMEVQKICVHVCGAVKSPGVYELAAGSRFYEAVEAAGGFEETACQDYLNMAAPLADGSRLEIPTLEAVKEREESERADSSAGGRTEYSYYTLPEKEERVGSESAENLSNGLVNINTADIAGLCNLPGVGEGRAKAIIEYREKQGGFQKKEDIMEVSGIGEKMYARMEAYLTIE